MLKLTESVYRQMRQEGERAYPEEGCGILIGVLDGESATVWEAVPVINASIGNRRIHYEIAPLDLIRADRRAREVGCDIVGFYHSHPDHPAHWSATDLAEAHWIGCSYVITSIAGGAAAGTNSFRLDGAREEDKRFEAEEIRVEAGGDFSSKS